MSISQIPTQLWIWRTSDLDLRQSAALPTGPACTVSSWLASQETSFETANQLCS